MTRVQWNNSVVEPNTEDAQKISPENEDSGGHLRLPALDGVRGVAILLVLANHILPLSEHKGIWILNLLVEVQNCSWVGVNLFFALSGFLITGILIDTLQSRHFFRDFYARRALRILPLYYGFIFVLLLLTRALHFSWGGWQYFYLTYTANLALWWNKPLLLSHFRIDHLWSLQVEEQFYLVCPLIVYRVKNHWKLIRIFLAACVVALALRIALVTTHAVVVGETYLPYSFTLCCCDNLLYGCALSLLFRTGWRYKIQRWSAYIFVLCTLPVIAERIAHKGAPWTDTFFMPTFGFTLIGIACASLIAMALTPATFSHRFFSLSIFRFFGKYSYGLYIIHYSIHGFLTSFLHLFFFEHTHSPIISVFLSAGIVAGVSLLMAILSYHLYEIRFLRLKKYFSYNRTIRLTTT